VSSLARKSHAGGRRFESGHPPWDPERPSCPRLPPFAIVQVPSSLEVVSRVRAGAWVLILACALVVSGRGGEGRASEVRPKPLVGRDSVRLIRAPAGVSFHDPVWLPTLDKIVFTLSPAPGDAFRKELASVAIDGSGLEPLPLPDEPGCKYTSKTLPTPLGDGRLGYVQQCWPGGGRVVRLMAWNPQAEIAEPLVQYRLLFLQGPFACSPDLSTCVINDRKGLYEQLQRVGPDGLEPLDLPLERAGFPSWSPDGRWIAVDGVPEGANGSGLDRLELPRDLYLLSADLERLRPLVRDVITSAGPLGHRTVADSHSR
jgi:hypothetical protein